MSKSGLIMTPERCSGMCFDKSGQGFICRRIFGIRLVQQAIRVDEKTIVTTTRPEFALSGICNIQWREKLGVPESDAVERQRFQIPLRALGS